MGSRHSRVRKRKLRRESQSILPSLTLEEAKAAIREDRPQDSDQMLRLIAAANLLCADPISELVDVDDFLHCVRRSGVAAEMGARALNVRLGRRKDEDIQVEDIIVDEGFWIDYVARSGHGKETAQSDNLS